MPVFNMNGYRNSDSFKRIYFKSKSDLLEYICYTSSCEAVSATCLRTASLNRIITIFDCYTKYNIQNNESFKSNISLYMINHRSSIKWCRQQICFCLRRWWLMNLVLIYFRFNFNFRWTAFSLLKKLIF